MKRTLASIDERVWEAAALQQTHASTIERDYTPADLRAFFAAYGRIRGVKQKQYEPDSDLVAKMQALKASFGGASA